MIKDQLADKQTNRIKERGRGQYGPWILLCTTGIDVAQSIHQSIYSFIDPSASIHVGASPLQRPTGAAPAVLFLK
jgi:hypothetical protein